tara:strand:+ start:102 stop:452 length:351 start_codon:yes stop_codon:yes gene_type:complete
MKAYFGDIDINSLDIPVDKEYPGKNNDVGRRYFLNILHSIKNIGVKRPIIVRENEVLIGGARVRAVKHLGHKTISAIVFSSTNIPNLRKIKSYDELLKISRLSELIVTEDLFKHRN